MSIYAYINQVYKPKCSILVIASSVSGDVAFAKEGIKSFYGIVYIVLMLVEAINIES